MSMSFIATICEYALNSGTGNQTFTQNLNPGRMSRYDELEVQAYLTTCDTDAADILDIALQESTDGGVTWNDRLRLSNIFGSYTASSTAPKVLTGVVKQERFLTDLTEWEPSGSNGASRLTPGTCLNGPFADAKRTAAGPQASWRLYIATTDANTNASFIGTVSVIARYRI